MGVRGEKAENASFTMQMKEQSYRSFSNWDMHQEWACECRKEQAPLWKEKADFQVYQLADGNMVSSENAYSTDSQPFLDSQHPLENASS